MTKKYINAEKLIAEIAVLKKGVINKWLENPRSSIDDGFLTACSRFLEIIASLQQEQSEVDLEKEMTAYIERHFHIRYDETLEVGNDPLTTHDFEEIARHFAEWGAIHLNARKEE